MLGGLRAAVRLILDGRGAELALPASRLNPWCGLCGAASGDWIYEIGWSRPFPDWAAAERALRESEADQRATAALLNLLDATFDARLQRDIARQVDDPNGPAV